MTQIMQKINNTILDNYNNLKTLLFVRKEIYGYLLLVIISLIILNIICDKYTKYKFHKYIENFKKENAEIEEKKLAEQNAKQPSIIIHINNNDCQKIDSDNNDDNNNDDNDNNNNSNDDDDNDDSDSDYVEEEDSDYVEEEDSDYVEEEDSDYVEEEDSDYEENDKHEKSVLIFENYKNNTTKIININTITQEQTKNFKPTYLRINGVEHNVLRYLKNVIIIILETYSRDKIYKNLKYIQYKKTHYTKEGYKYHSNLKISLAPVDSCRIINEIVHLSNSFGINIILNLEKWDNNSKHIKKWQIVNN